MKLDAVAFVPSTTDVIKTMTFTITRTPQRLLLSNGDELAVETLDITLPFARKPVDLSDTIGGGELYKIHVTDVIHLSTFDYDQFANHLLGSYPWLAGKGGYVGMSGRLCVEVNCPGRPTLFVDPSGDTYARYVARLG